MQAWAPHPTPPNPHTSTPTPTSPPAPPSTPSTPPQHGLTPLHMAAGQGHLQPVKTLLAAKKTHIDSRDKVRAGGGNSRVLWPLGCCTYQPRLNRAQRKSARRRAL